MWVAYELDTGEPIYKVEVAETAVGMPWCRAWWHPYMVETWGAKAGMVPYPGSWWALTQLDLDLILWLKNHLRNGF